MYTMCKDIPQKGTAIKLQPIDIAMMRGLGAPLVQ